MLFCEEEFCDQSRSAIAGISREIVADKVEIYYWPHPHADTSYLGITGDEVNDLAAGATTGSLSDVYWAYTFIVSPATSLGVAQP